jgi:hypothetical protein
MKIEIIVDRDKLRRVHRALQERLVRAFPNAEIRLRAAADPAPLPIAVPLLLKLERLVYRRGRETLCDLLPGAQFEAPGASASDIVIDFSSTGDARARAGSLRLCPLFDDAAGEAGLIGALAEGRAPRLAIKNVSTGEVVATGLPSLETGDGLTGGMEAVYSRLFILIEQAIKNPQRAALRSGARTAPDVNILSYAARSLSRNAARLLYHAACYSPHWRIGWRFNDGPGVMELGALDGPRWNVLADRGHDCYADPFPIVWRGKTCIFFESLDHRVGKGVIGVVEFGPNGPIGEATTIIEEPWHLSYPFLIEAEGELWMIPESSTSGQVPLYRCVDFPHRWERCDPLLEGIEAADATIFAHDGRYYMTSVVREGLGGYSDTLALHHAPSLFGPWRKHPASEALIDAGAARPAGAVIERAGALWRPVQDCRKGYGRALRLARIDRLDPEHFQQTFTAQIGSGPLWPGGRLHTVNRAGRLETIDGVAITPKFAPLRPLIARRYEPSGDAVEPVASPVAMGPAPARCAPN